MFDQFKMVFVNLVLSAILILFICVYKYFYPKRKIQLFSVLLAISAIACVSIFRNGVYESGDFTIHIYRTIDFYRSLSEGNIMPSWAGTLNATYGYPLFIFNYALPYYFMSFFHFFGFSFIDSIKLFLASNFILSGVFMYICAKKLFQNITAAFITAIFYQFAPYHLIDLHFKNVVGEIMIFTFIPLTMFCLQKLWQEKNLLWYSATSLVTALLIMSHVVLALFAMVLFLAYALFLSTNEKKKLYFVQTSIVFLLGSIATIYVWLTPFFLTQYTLFKHVVNFVYFPQIWELLYAPWRFGLLFQGHKGELSFLLGYTHIIVFITLLLLLFKKKLTNKYKSKIVFWIVAFTAILFLITPYSKFLWGIFTFLQVTGSHRLLILAAFVSAILAGYLCLHILKRKKLLLLLVIITVFSTILNWGNRKVIPQITEQKLINNLPKSTFEGEGHFYANSEWRSMKDPWFTTVPKNHLQITRGNAEIKDIRRTSTDHTYVVSNQDALSLQDNTLYFPGWQGYDNGKTLELKPDTNGIISFKLSKGLHLIDIKYSDVFIYMVLKTISLVTFLILTGILLITIVRNKRKILSFPFKRLSSNHK